MSKKNSVQEVDLGGLNMPVWIMIKKAFIDVTADYPEVLRLFSKKLKEIEEVDNARRSS